MLQTEIEIKKMAPITKNTVSISARIRREVHARLKAYSDKMPKTVYFETVIDEILEAGLNAKGL